MSLIPTGNLTPFTALYPQFGDGTYIGLVPGSSNVPLGYKGYGGAANIATGSGLTIQTDANTGVYMSSIQDQPQNVLRITGAFGTGFIQGTDIAFATPFSGAAGVRILPSTNQINARVMNFASSIGVLNAQTGVGLAYNINWNQLGSTIKGYNWANTN